VAYAIRSISVCAGITLHYTQVKIGAESQVVKATTFTQCVCVCVCVRGLLFIMHKFTNVIIVICQSGVCIYVCL